MKVQELRQIISSADRVLLEKAFVETYKQLTKSQKEEADVLIQAALSGENAKTKKKKETVSFEELEMQIITFIGNAKEGNYFAPNRVIPKSQRPKWRFLMKGYLKELEKIKSDSEYYERALNLLTKLYELICQACQYYLFSTDDPFRSIGWLQGDFYHLVAAKTFEGGYTREKIAKMAELACTGGLSRISLHYDQEREFISLLHTSDVKEIAVEECKEAIRKRKEKLTSIKEDSHLAFYLREDIDNFCDLILAISLLQAETEQGVKYYFKNCMESRKEIILYKALEVADLTGTNEQWIEIYKYGLAKKIKPRESLIREYQDRIKEKNKDE